ncbi:hypothetical protein G2W53_010609 [Senna tora]|uniref:Uncharacterized protein n=1 Tax=Senna tora TaxID=362788 RepID=A0A834X141_9FABA|nr:hypothetical protein G2W53_010609 [Senna tora]
MGHARQTRLTSSYPRSSTSPPLSPPLDGLSSHPSLEPSDVPLDASPQAEPQPSTHPQGLSDSSNNAQPPMVGKDPTDGRTWIIPDGDTLPYCLRYYDGNENVFVVKLKDQLEEENVYAISKFLLGHNGDIIGLLTGKSDVHESNNNGKSSKRIDIELIDLEISEVRGTISSNVSQILNTSSVAVEEDLLTLTVAKKIDELDYSCSDCGNLVDSVVPRFKLELKLVVLSLYFLIAKLIKFLVALLLN